MIDLWLWGGKYYGRRIGDHLIHQSGHCTGIFQADTVYDRDGRYLGELIGERLIRDKAKAGWSGPAAPNTYHGALPPQREVAPNALFPGHEEFPLPD